MMAKLAKFFNTVNNVYKVYHKKRDRLIKTKIVIRSAVSIKMLLHNFVKSNYGLATQIRQRDQLRVTE